MAVNAAFSAIKNAQINKEDIGTPEELMKIMRDTIKSH